MNEETYLKERVDDQIGWYDKKSRQAQARYKALRGFEVIAAAAIPLLTGFAPAWFPVAPVVGVLGACIAVSASISSLNQYQQHWTAYRTTCETLQHEKYLYLTQAVPYQQQAAFQLFVQRIEGVISKEHSAWLEQTRRQEQGDVDRDG